MPKHLAAALVALSLALVPAQRAAANETSSAVAGLAALAILGALVSQNRTDASPAPRGRILTQGYAPRRDFAPAVRTAPERCRLQARHRDGLYGERCLTRAGYRVDRLPRECFDRVRTDRGVRWGVEGRCLHQPRWHR